MKTAARIIKESPVSTMVSYAGGVLIYQAGDFKFRVPTEELGTAPVYQQDRTAMFMKWIKRELELSATKESKV